MPSKCGECQLFQGSSSKCGGGKKPLSSVDWAKTCSSFKGPASLFSAARCGGCRLFEGSVNECDAGKKPSSSLGWAKTCSSYAPIPG